MTSHHLSHPYDSDQREGSGVRAIAVTGVIFAFLALVMLPFTLGGFTSYGWPISGGKTAPMELWILFSTLFGLLLAVMLLLGSFGSYRFQQWGRSLMLLWSVLSLAYGVVGIYFFGRWLIPSLRGEFARNPAVSPLAPLCCWAVGTLFALCIVRYFRRPGVRACFHRVD